MQRERLTFRNTSLTRYEVALHSGRRDGLMVSALDSESSAPGSSPGARFSKVPETFRARKAIFSSSVSENGEVYTPEISCVERTKLLFVLIIRK